MPILQFRYGFSFILLLFITVGLYWAGLSGIFLLDDEPNFTPLQFIQDMHLWAGILQYITEGEAGWLGRPLSLFTFALQYHDWSNNPWAFKYVNLMIHLINGCLVFWFCLLLTRLLSLPAQKGLLISWLTVALWLVHPLQISTVLYAVQRMTLLVSLFTLVGLILYLTGREYLVKQKVARGYLWMSLGLLIGGGFAIFSKENGILLIFYVLVLELTVLNAVVRPRYWQIWMSGFIYLPIGLLIVYFSFKFNSLVQSYAVRDFNLIERLLTETRVLWDYVSKILLLQSSNFGLFHDDFVISRSLLNPISTLFASLALILAIILSLWQRRRYALVALAVLWFIAGQWLESSFIALAIYFEHRNYLPMLGILFALIYGIVHLFERLPDSWLRHVAIGLICLWLAAFPAITWTQTQVWGNPTVQAVLWAKQKPQSRYALSHVATLLEQRGKYDLAFKYFQQMLTTFPRDTGPYMSWVILACEHSQIPEPTPAAVRTQFAEGLIDTAALSNLDYLLQARLTRKCEMDSGILGTYIEALWRNPNPGIYKYYIERMYAIYLMQEGKLDAALQHLDAALQLKDIPQYRLDKINWLARANQVAKALAYLQQTRQQWNQITRDAYKDQLDSLEQQLKQLL